MTLTALLAWAAQARKFLVAAAAALTAIISLNVLTGTAQHYAIVLSTVIGAILVHQLPNAARK